MPEYMTIPETARLLRIGQRTAYQMARSGKLPGAARVAGQWRVSQTALREWLAQGGEAALEPSRTYTKRKRG